MKKFSKIKRREVDNFPITDKEHAERSQLWAQRNTAGLILSVDDKDGKKHAIFAAAALMDVLSKVNEMEAYYAEKEDRKN